MQTKPNCAHFPQADDICFVCPIIFDWKPIAIIPHTYSATVGGFLIGRYDQPSDGSTWVTITGPAGTPYPGNPKKFPDRISAELWAADTVRLLSVAPTETKTMNGNPDEGTAPMPSNEPTGNPPGQVEHTEPPKEPERPTDPTSEPTDHPADFEEGDELEDECDDWDEDSDDED